MKKIFTLISMALVAMSVNAQETWKASDLVFENQEVGGSQKPVLTTAVESDNTGAVYLIPQDVKQFPEGTYPDNMSNVTTWLDANNGAQYASTLKEYTFTVNTGDITLKAVSTPNSDAAKNEAWQLSTATNEALDTDDCIIKFSNYVKPKNGDPSLGSYDFYDTNSDGDATHRVANVFWTPGCSKLPVKGCYYEFTSQKSGTLLVAACMWKNLPQRPLYIIDESTADAGYTVLAPDKIKVEGVLQNNGWNGWHGKVWHTFKLNENFYVTEDNGEGTFELAPNSRTFFGYITFDIEANKTYMVMNPNNQMGLYGYYFQAGSETAISNVKAATESDAPIYNLAGQKVDKGFKGVVIQNGKKMIQK